VKLETRLRALLAVIVEEAHGNPEFEARLIAALGDKAAPASADRAHRSRRDPAVLDPFTTYAEGEHVLRQRLEGLSLEELKDIVAEHGMDKSKLAMKWKSEDRLIELVVATVGSRSRKGDAFRP
jgi:hypothetical protein